MTLGQQFAEIIQSKMDTLPLEEVGEVFTEKTKNDTRRGVDPTGQSYVPYAESTAKKKGRSSPVTMRDRSRSVETLDQQARELSTRLEFEGNAGYGSSSKPAGEVFYMHQKGEARGNKVRKVFPEPEDMTSPGVTAALENVEKILEDHFNE